MRIKRRLRNKHSKTKAPAAGWARTKIKPPGIARRFFCLRIVTRHIYPGYNNTLPTNRPLYTAIRQLRYKGLTYTEINQRLNTTTIPKSSLSYICRDIKLSPEQQARINNAALDRLARQRVKAVLANRKKLENQIAGCKATNQELETILQDKRVKMIALAMLYLGEGAKWQKSRAPKLANTNPMIIQIYIRLLEECYGVTVDALRCRVQHRADQNSESLIAYWSEVTGVPPARFYPCYVDMRTAGYTTKKSDYHGVCTVMSAGTHIQLELAEIAGIIYKTLRGIGAVG